MDLSRTGRGKKFSKIVLLVGFLFTVIFAMAPANAQNQNSDSDDTQDRTMFFAYLQNDEAHPGGPLYEMFKDMPVARELLSTTGPGDRKYRPMLQWRAWAEKRLPFLPSLAFCTFVAWVFWAAIPGTLTNAQQLCRQEFWRTFLIGCLANAVWITLARAVFLTHVGWPGGIVLIGFFQLWLVVGLSVVISLIGHAVSVLLRLKKVLATRPVALRLIEIFLGALIVAALLMIPSPEGYPRIGTRLVALFAVLGTGGIFRALRARSTTTV